MNDNDPGKSVYSQIARLLAAARSPDYITVPASEYYAMRAVLPPDIYGLPIVIGECVSVVGKPML